MKKGSLSLSSVGIFSAELIALVQSGQPILSSLLSPTAKAGGPKFWRWYDEGP